MYAVSDDKKDDEDRIEFELELLNPVFWIVVLLLVGVWTTFSGCTSLGNRVVGAVGEEIVHESRTAMNLDRRVTLLEKGTDHLRTDAELMKNSFNYVNRVMDRRLEKIETMLDRKMDRMLDMEEKILNILKDKRISGRLR